MLLKVRGQIADCNAALALGRRGPFARSAQLIGRPTFRAQPLLARCGVQAQKHERVYRRGTRLDNPDQLRRQLVQLGPIAKLFQQVRQLGYRRGERRIDLERRTERRHSFVQPAEPAQSAAQVAERFGVARPQAHRGAIARHRFFECARHLQQIAQIVVRLGEVRRLCDRLAVTGGCFGQRTLQRQRTTEVVRRHREVRIAPDGPAQQLHRLARMAFLQRGHPKQVQRLRLVRSHLQNLDADLGCAGQIARPRQVARQSHGFFDREGLRHRISIAVGKPSMPHQRAASSYHQRGIGNRRQPRIGAATKGSGWFHGSRFRRGSYFESS